MPAERQRCDKFWAKLRPLVSIAEERDELPSRELGRTKKTRAIVVAKRAQTDLILQKTSHFCCPFRPPPAPLTLHPDRAQELLSHKVI